MLLLLSIGLLCLVLREQGLKAASFRLSKGGAAKGAEGIYHAVVTGDKSGVSKKQIKTIQNFGLMHLLTPSGLHLGSLLLLLKLAPKLRIFTILSLMGGLFFIPGLYSMKRMLVFYLSNHFVKNTSLSFLLTFGICLVNGNFQDSPLSYCFSLLFWGCIVFHKKGPLSLAWNLFGIQAFIGLLFQQEVNLLSFVVNPLVTALFTPLFPPLLALYPLESTRGAGNIVFEGFESLLNFLGSLSLLNMQPEFALVFFATPLMKNKKILISLLLALPLTSSSPKGYIRQKKRAYHPIPATSEFIDAKARKIEFIDRRCGWKLTGDISCRRMGDKYENPSL